MVPDPTERLLAALDVLIDAQRAGINLADVCRADRGVPGLGVDFVRGTLT